MASGRRAAFFDVDGTLAATNIVRYYAHLRTHAMPAPLRLAWTLAYAVYAIRWLVLDLLDREEMNRVFYRGYRGMDATLAQHVARRDFDELLGNRVFPAARARVAEHQTNGDLVVLLTGSLDFLIRPLASGLGATDLIAVTMGEAGGRFTGELTSPPLGGERKAEAAREWAVAHGVDLASSWAYGDATSDLAILSMVGHGVAVNPGRRLAHEARRRGLTIERWS